MKKQIIGILGGMGPGASNYLYKTLIDFSIKYFGAKNNDDFPDILLDSVPVPDFISSSSKKRAALNMLKNRVKVLNIFKPSCLVIACNTAHIFLNDLQEISKTPFVSMVNEVVKNIHEDGINKVGLLATPSTIKDTLYQKALQEKGISAIIPSKKEQALLEKIIRNILKGRGAGMDQKKLILIANSLKQRGAGGIILGCTELPLIFPKKYSLPIYNSVEILAMALLRNYYK